MSASQKSWYRRKRIVIPTAFLAAGLAVVAVSVVSPWPTSLLIRGMFDKGAADTVAEMDPYVPDGVASQPDVEYATQGADTTLDVFYPDGTTSPQATVIWIHGGAWISGDKTSVNPYAQMIAAEGYTAVTVNYTVSPEAVYPVALEQLNSALGYLVDNADELNIDPNRIVIAGDSAGAQLTSQLANLATNPEFATEMGIAPQIDQSQLVGVILNCGIYDVSGVADAPGIGAWGLGLALWSYLGDRDWSHTTGASQMSSVAHVTADFPATWISGGNGDPLTDTQSKPLAEKLTFLGVPVTEVFYAADHTPELPHEYQFHLDYPDAQTALQSTLEFLSARTQLE
ncbi:alpha/beta hydrolase [Demequina oxidasica]|uniref:alpha/beta hydrolase n=1 Tax=Demequina oxidasica TaxID=676199 RepID=UPI000782D3A1|nr:alpha/beta hydrolase [Demequina oxidasica]